MSVMPRKICFVITSFIHYSRSLLILDELKKRNDVDLHVILGGAALLSQYLSKFVNLKVDLERGGFRNIHETYFNLEGSLGVTKAKTAGLGTIEFSSLFEKIKPDVVVVRGDRFEVLAAAIAAAYMNIPIAHIEGGDLSGTIDESVRHSITKLAHIHFATNDDAKNRVIKMGENPDYVFNFGSPDVEVVHKSSVSDVETDRFQETGSGAAVNLKEPFLMVMFHPVSTEIGTLGEKTRELLWGVHETHMPALWFWPNFDAGAEEISHELRVFRDTVPEHKIRFTRYIPPYMFISLLRNAKCLIGNSSAGLKECSYLGVPVVNVGSRQANRLRADNVLDVPIERNAVKMAIEKQVLAGRYTKSAIYQGQNTACRIAEKLATVTLYVQKKFF